MGTRGPVPKRTSDRLGHLTKAEKAAVTSVDVTGPVVVPPANDGWHEVARDWYTSLAASGQAKFFEPSDWAAAQLTAAEMSRMLRAKVSATMFAAIWSAMGDLLTTEAERRRVKLEINRKPPKADGDAKVANLDDYRDL